MRLVGRPRTPHPRQPLITTAQPSTANPLDTLPPTVKLYKNCVITCSTCNQIDNQPNDTYSVHMSDTIFDWNARKNAENIRKHGVSFEEAQTVFLDENAIRFHDPEHSGTEDRFLMLGLSLKSRTLVVCHCYRNADRVIRLISARKANRKEQNDYLHYWE